MLTRLLLLAAYLVASLSASDATRGDTLRLTAGCESGVVRIEPQQGLAYSATRGTGLAQRIDVRVLPEAWPTVRTLMVVCDDAQQGVTLGVRGGFVVFAPMAAKSPAG